MTGFTMNAYTPSPQPFGTFNTGVGNSVFGGNNVPLQSQPFQMPGLTQGGGNQGGGLFSNIWQGIGGMQGLNTGISAFSNLANIYAGFKSLGLAEDQLDFAKSSFNRNFEAQAKAYNNELRDQWAARNASAKVRGDNFQGMDAWLSDRKVGG